MHNQVLLLPSDKEDRLPFQAGVSLHGHTRHSIESLSFIGKFLQEHSFLRAWIERQRERCKQITGIGLDFDRAYWTPPLCERQAYGVEADQIVRLGLRPMVSLSDHNDIQAPILLRQLPEYRETPISTEWTIPFGQAIFHIGVHNLPDKLAQVFIARFREATERADESAIFELLSELDRIPSVLLIFNHPVWNLNGIAPSLFAFELRRFLDKANGCLHGFELNGMRSHSENRELIRLAMAWGQLVVSGGDRHACEPNAAINLTNAADFPEFVDEIRVGKQSTVLLMPQYAEPLNWRFYQSFTHIIGKYPGHPIGRRSWDERTFHPNIAGEMVPMVDLWQQGPPSFLKNLFTLAILSANFPVHAVSRIWMSGKIESLLLPGKSQSTSIAAADEAHGPQIVPVQLSRRGKEYI